MLDMARVFQKMCLIRHFELETIKAVEEGRIHCPVYLSMGQESLAVVLSEVYPTARVFPQHRGHAVYLAYGGSPKRLRDELLGLETGCCQGMGGSSDIQSRSVEAHHGLLGENIPLATGYALASGEQTVAYFGDGAVEEDYAAVSFGFAATHKLPILFACENNGLAILTPISARRSWTSVKMAKGFGLDATECFDNPGDIYKALEDITLPAFIDVSTVRHRWHVGIGQDSEPGYDILASVREDLVGSAIIEKEMEDEMRKLWQP